MTLPDPPKLTYRDGLKKVGKEYQALKADVANTDSSSQILDEMKRRAEEWEANSEKRLKEKTEDARNTLGSWIIKTFCSIIFTFAIVGAYIAIDKDDTHMKNFVSVAQTIGALLSGAVGFVLGHYFTNKNGQ